MPWVVLGTNRTPSLSCLLRLSRFIELKWVFPVGGPGEGGVPTTGWPVACCIVWLLVTRSRLELRSERLMSR